MPVPGQPTENMKKAFEAVRALDCHRDRLADVDITLLAAYASKDKDGLPRGEALAKDGDPILGKIRIMSIEDRADGSSDVRVLLHGDRWGSLSAGMQRSVIDTCLMRIEVLVEDGKTKCDDLGRPVLRKRKWDYQLYGFVEADERHGKSSIGVHNMSIFFNEHGQTYMPWIDDDPPEDFLSMPIRPKRKPKALAEADGSCVRGALAAKRVRERLQHVTERATVLGVLVLELEHAKPRDPVIKAIKDRLFTELAIEDFIAVEKNLEASVEPDRAAAALVTSKSKPPIEFLELVVPECRDVKVLGWILDDEGEDDPREEVLEVVNQRIRELSSEEH